MIKKRYECCGRCNRVDDICIADKQEELYMLAKDIYLDKPIKINGIEIKHTKKGLEYLIGHYEYMLTVNSINRLTGPARKPEDEDYMRRLVENWKLHLKLYELQK